MKTTAFDLYTSSLKKAWRLTVDHWKNLIVMVVLVLLCELGASFLFQVNISSSFIWYVLFYLLLVTLVAGCLALVNDVALRPNKSFKLRLSQFWPILYTTARCIMNGMCIILLLSYLTVGRFGMGAIYGCLFMAFMMFNAAPEVVSLHPDMLFPVLRYSLGFMQNCWPEWLLGNVPVLLPIAAFYGWHSTNPPLSEFQMLLSICGLAAFVFFALLLRRCYFQALEKRVLAQEREAAEQARKQRR